MFMGRGHTKSSRRCLYPVIFLTFLSLAFSCTPDQARNQTLKPPAGMPPFLDVHNHLFPHQSSQQGGLNDDFDGAAKTALEAMGEMGIQRMILMPPPFAPGMPGAYDLEPLQAVARKHPDKFAFMAGGGSLQLMLVTSAGSGSASPEQRADFEKTARGILDRGAVGFGELALDHFSMRLDHPYESVPGDHPWLLWLADLAAERRVPMDIHMEAIPEEMPLPEKFSAPNPKMLKPNMAAFERLLAHNPRAKIIWAHAGWCHTGRRTAALCREMLARHPNLYMSFKIGGDSLPEVRPLDQNHTLKPEWLDLIRTYPDRFVIGTDQFYMSPLAQKTMPKRAGGTAVLLSLLPPDLARQVGLENPRRLFNL